MRWSRFLVVVLFLGVVAVAAGARAAPMPEFHLALQHHKFEPSTLKVPADVKFKILVTNRNTTPSEFESADFNREKIVLPNSTITVFVGPLKKGTYKFFDDFDQAATGLLVVE